MVKRGWKWPAAALAALLAAALVPAALAAGALSLPPGRKTGELRTVTLPGGAELTLAWCGAGTVKNEAAIEADMSEFLAEEWKDLEDAGLIRLPVSAPKGAVRVPVDGFWIGVCEVTQKQWESVMGNNPSYFRGEELAAPSQRGELPVECVSWEDCAEFCRRTGLRLPTEMEWLRVHGIYWGQIPRSWTTANSGGRTHPVGGANAGESGVFDLDGNVSEWCADWLAPWPAAPEANYAGPATGTERVVCGRNWCGDESFDSIRLWKDRLSLPPASRYNNVGFRVCLSPAPSRE